MLQQKKWIWKVLKATATNAQKMKFSITDFCSKCEQIRSFLRIWSHFTEEIDNGTLYFLYSEPQISAFKAKLYRKSCFITIWSSRLQSSAAVIQPCCNSWLLIAFFNWFRPRTYEKLISRESITSYF